MKDEMGARGINILCSICFWNQNPMFRSHPPRMLSISRPPATFYLEIYNYYLLLMHRHALDVRGFPENPHVWLNFI